MSGGLTFEEKQVFMWAKALVCELHDRDYWPNEAIFLAKALQEVGMLPKHIAERIDLP